MNQMHSFTFRAVGNLARNPESRIHKGHPFVRFCLVGNDYCWDHEEPVPIVTSIWFVAHEDIGDEIMKAARKGDQLFVEGLILRDHAPKYPNEGRDDFAFMVLGFRLGATKRNPPGAAGARVTGQAPPPSDGAASEEATAAA